MSRILTLSTLLFLLAGCASSSGGNLIHYAGASESGTASYPDVQGEVGQAYAKLEAAFDAVRRGDHRGQRLHLEAAEALLSQALATNPHSRTAAEALGVVYFYQGYYGDQNGFQKCIGHLTQVLDVDPDAVQAARYLANAYSHLGDGKQVIYYAGYAESLTDDPALAQEMAKLRAPYQEDFLTSWYEYENYYESKGAIVKEVNPNTYQFDVVLQVTPDFERDLAAKGLQQITPSLQFSQDQEIQSYLQGLADRLVAKTPGPPFDYKVEVVESSQVNAMAFPGRILVSTGLLRFAETEAELVAVLAHELAHIYAHHSARQFMADFQNRRLASSLIDLANVQDERYTKLLDLGAQISLELIQRGYSRRQEKEADRYGTHIAFNAGYNPTFMTSFFLRLYEANPNQPFRLLSTHPPTTDRIEYTSSYLEGFPLDVEMQIDSEEFKTIKQRLQ